MFAGHLGAGLAIARSDRGTNPATFVFAALLLDLLLWVFVLAHWESAAIPGDFATRHQARYVFPYSHGLAGAIGWAALVGVALAFRPGTPAMRWVRRALLLAAAVLSHWVLDALVHAPELPLLGPASPMIGLALWDRMAAALTVEAGIVVAGLALFLPGAGLPRAKSGGLAVLCLVCLAFTIAGMTIAPPPPSAPAMAYGSLATIAATCAIAWGLGGRPRSDAAKRAER
jgi:hypothetical protein